MSLESQNEVTPEADERAQEPRVVSRVPWFSLILILCYSAVFAAQLGTDLDRSIELAGEDKLLVLERYEIWRMLTGAALHGSIIHYLMNSYAFYSFGRDLEMLTSRYHIPIVFLLSAIAGSILSLIVSPHGISIGASGGIIGLVGYLAVYSFKRRQFITSEFRRALLLNIGFILFYGFVLATSIDNSAHIGGLVTGALYALVQVSSDSYVDPTTASQHTRTAGLVSIGIYAAVCVFAILVIVRFV